LVDEGRRAELDAVGGGELAAADGDVVDPDAVGRAEVDEDDRVAFEPQFGVPAGDAGVGELQVAVGAAADDGDGVGEEVGAFFAAALGGVGLCLAVGASAALAGLPALVRTPPSTRSPAETPLRTRNTPVSTPGVSSSATVTGPTKE
jgi:hypothetical protein